MKRALVIGHRGQDGSYLCEQLRARGYAVAGLGRDGGLDAPDGGQFDLLERDDTRRLIAGADSHEVYYLAAFHHSSEMARPDDYGLLRRSLDVHTIGLLNVIDAIKQATPGARLFYAASSHLFGEPVQVPQSELTPFAPNGAYGITKLAGVQIVRFYRENSGLFAACGFLYNHESPRRRAEFLTRKIAAAAVAIHRGRARELRLGDLAAEVDWGYAPDYTDAMWRILQLDAPDDFVIANGRLHSVRDFVEIVFSILDLDWRAHIVEDPSIITKRERRKPLLGDATKLARMTGWAPTVDLEGIARRLVESELADDANR